MSLNTCSPPMHIGKYKPLSTCSKTIYSTYTELFNYIFPVHMREYNTLNLKKIVHLTFTYLSTIIYILWSITIPYKSSTRDWYFLSGHFPTGFSPRSFPPGVFPRFFSSVFVRLDLFSLAFSTLGRSRLGLQLPRTFISLP